jgi:hypothetical protein
MIKISKLKIISSMLKKKISRPVEIETLGGDTLSKP